ncbi:hypothetical protein [Granulicella arctica]|uniref:hypothetical protein n=1 Tax=Granulicella arctica TaxID=940613 RepID=UPI0021E02245|nr:hypothetical protein [Granulicella arctica]
MTDQHTPLDPESTPRDTPDSPQDEQPDTVATPEGDNEYAPDQPLKPAPEGLQRTPAIDTNKV